MQKLIKYFLGGNSMFLAIIYTIGHILIAMTTTYIITGAALELAALNALVEPCINGVWFYILHSTWLRIRQGRVDLSEKGN